MNFEMLNNEGNEFVAETLAHLNKMLKSGLPIFRMDIPGDDLWDCYLNKIPEVATLDTQLEILKDRIAELKLRASKNATEVAKATTKARLQELLAEKKNDELKNLSVEELEKKIAELS